MSKIKPAILTVTLACLAAWALAPAILPTDTEQASLVTPGQVNVYELMSVSTSLPAQSYQAY